VGKDFISANGESSFDFFVAARLALIPFWVLGAVVAFAYSRTLWGKEAAIATVVLWCSCPEILAWSSTIGPDAPAASLGLLSVWSFRVWLDSGRWGNALAAGASLGLALLAKSSWLVLIPIFPFLTFLHPHARNLRFQLQLAALTILAFILVSSGFGFQRILQPLGTFKFYSSTLSGSVKTDAVFDRVFRGGNRFSGTWMASIPVPLPASYLEGIDLQKKDFEDGKWSYLCGEYKFGGWWYWYLAAALFKTPIGTLILLIICCFRDLYRLGVALLGQLRGHEIVSAISDCMANRHSLHEKTILLTPALVLFVVVSSETGFTRYLRYVLPCFPFLFVWIGQLFNVGYAKAFSVRWFVHRTLLSWSVVSSALVMPHSMSYFNELVGGPASGSLFLIDSCIDWGQDVLFLKKWTLENPNADPLFVALNVFFDPRDAGIPCRETSDEVLGNLGSIENRKKLVPGWYAISVTRLRSREEEFAYLRGLEPDVTIGYSIYVYRLSQADIAAWQHDLDKRPVSL
jgi:4-amino-4-deoxy-L-arabinose transferase-like glycosyltransferase